MPWRKFEFKGQHVFVRVLPTGKPIVRRSLVELRYKLGATKSYKTTKESLTEIEGEEGQKIIEDVEMTGQPAKAAGTNIRDTPLEPADEDTIIVYTDGACSGNPGPAGIGVYIERKDKTIHIAEFIGSGTNNIAELKAILKGLSSLSEEDRKQRVHLYTDSRWSLGVLIDGWKAKTNLKLIGQVREAIDAVPNVELLKIAGHSGHPGNEEADRLATTAVRREDSLIREYPRR